MSGSVPVEGEKENMTELRRYMLTDDVRACYVAVCKPGEYALGVAVYGERGYLNTTLPTWATWDEAHAEAMRLNRGLGLSEEEVNKITLSSMFG